MIELAAKLIGALSVILVSLIYGRIKIREVRRRLDEMTAFLALVAYIGENIEHFMKPIPEILEEFENDYLSSCGFLEKAKEVGLENAWRNGEFLLPNEAYAILQNYFINVGSGYLDDEKKLSGYTERGLCRILENERASSKDKERIYRAVPPMIAGSIVLILI